VVLMGSLPKLNLPPHPTQRGAVRDYMRDKIMPFIKSPDPDDIGWIHIIDPTQITSTLNVDTGVMTVVATPIWSGYARIQPIRNSVSTWRATNPTTTRIVQFWVEFPEDQTIDLKPGLRVAVELGGNDPWLTEYQYTIVGAINSSSAWQRTIDTQTDLENRPNYDMTNWPKPDADAGVC
jgi:hypothetical protein